MTISKHYQYERKEREIKIQKVGEGKVFRAFYFKEGKGGHAETHLLSDTGVITIINCVTQVIITKYIARPGQIKRYFTKTDPAPQFLIQLAYDHFVNGYTMQKREEKFSLFFSKKLLTTIQKYAIL